MARQIEKNAFISGMLAAMNEGSVSVPYMLLKCYPALQLSDEEAMLLVHLIAFQEREDKGFPTIEELQSRMSAKPSFVAETLQKLIKSQLLAIEEGVDEAGIRFETYNLQPLFEKLARCYIDEAVGRAEDDHPSDEIAAASAGDTLDDFLTDHDYRADQGDDGLSGSTTVWMEESEKSKQVFASFEQEYARPLSPMEYEAISGWIDRYSKDLILLALREAVFAGKLHFRYIDRILLEWERQRIKTVEQAKAYTQNFRGG